MMKTVAIVAGVALAVVLIGVAIVGERARRRELEARARGEEL
jgi:hypothetical protein